MPAPAAPAFGAPAPGMPAPASSVSGDWPVPRAAGRAVAVHRTTPRGLAHVIADLVSGHAASSVAVPADVPREWLSALPAATALRSEGPSLTPGLLGATDAAITGCALAVAETGDIALVDGGTSQGGEALSRLPGHHICVLYATEAVGGPADARRLLAPDRAVTWITAPATATATTAPTPRRGARTRTRTRTRTLDVVFVTGTQAPDRP
ncbi:LUD domain-containing protein [Streptomyces sp. NBC_00536]|uniref:LUD domain-containing protein n=1 Tax=Streptomyces sp. NBC_00536 TaxID=2975769 RepID=UPI002E81D81A|nr:LUD domain-containing protein [Streptomyces sp. NBC_00536]WUC77074.1 LUD domain-containing protein [Streptomyces sp. NBC_00536]